MSRVWLRVLLALFVSVHCLPLTEAVFRTASNNDLLLESRAVNNDDDVSGDTTLLSRKKRYTVSRNRGWKKRHVTFTFINNSSKLSSVAVQAEFTASPAEWSPFAAPNNQKTSDDGKNRLLARAFYPNNDHPRIIHFDKDDDWMEQDADLETADATRNTKVPYHASTTQRPYQQPFPHHNSFCPATDVPPVFCFCNYDTIQILRNKKYGFKDQWVWVFIENDRQLYLEEGYPKRLVDAFPGLPNICSVDAAYETSDGMIALFSGKLIYKFNRNLDLTIETLSRYQLPPTTQELQAVFLSKEDRKTYLFEKSQYWVFDERTNEMDVGYPKPMAEPISSALFFQEHTYFFSGCAYWNAIRNPTSSSSAFIPDKPDNLRQLQDVTIIWQYPCYYDEKIH